MEEKVYKITGQDQLHISVFGEGIVLDFSELKGEASLNIQIDEAKQITIIPCSNPKEYNGIVSILDQSYIPYGKVNYEAMNFNYYVMINNGHEKSAINFSIHESSRGKYKINNNYKITASCPYYTIEGKDGYIDLTPYRMNTVYVLKINKINPTGFSNQDFYISSEEYPIDPNTETYIPVNIVIYNYLKNRPDIDNSANTLYITLPNTGLLISIGNPDELKTEIDDNWSYKIQVVLEGAELSRSEIDCRSSFRFCGPMYIKNNISIRHGQYRKIGMGNSNSTLSNEINITGLAAFTEIDSNRNKYEASPYQREYNEDIEMNILNGQGNSIRIGNEYQTVIYNGNLTINYDYNDYDSYPTINVNRSPNFIFGGYPNTSQDTCINKNLNIRIKRAQSFQITTQVKDKKQGYWNVNFLGPEAHLNIINSSESNPLFNYNNKPKDKYNIFNYKTYIVNISPELNHILDFTDFEGRFIVDKEYDVIVQNKYGDLAISHDGILRLPLKDLNDPEITWYQVIQVIKK